MVSTYSVAQAQSQLPSLLKEAESGATVGIARRNETVAFLISRARLEAIVETLELLANPQAVRAVAAHRSGRIKFVPLSRLGAAGE